jgi:hypothetical protein
MEKYFLEIMNYLNQTNEQYCKLIPGNIKTYPIPYFGSIGTAELITVGVNPAISEFAEIGKWPTEMSSSDLEYRCTNYFHIQETPHPWFEVWEEAINILGYSYYKRNAAHVDLSPRATYNMGEVNPDEFLEMVKSDIVCFFKTLGFATQCKLLYLAGSVTKKWNINEFLENNAENYDYKLTPRFIRNQHPGSGKVFKQCLKISNKVTPVFFCSISPSSRNRTLLIVRTEENKNDIKELINKSNCC